MRLAGLSLGSMLLVMASLSGCTDQPLPAGTDDVEDIVEAPLLPLLEPRAWPIEFAGTACEEVGAVTHNSGLGPLAKAAPHAIGVPEPFTLADTTEYTGLSSDESGLMIGNAHMALACSEWTIAGKQKSEPTGGWVGLVVEPPPFGGIEPTPRNYLISTISSNDEDLVAAIHGLGFHTFPGVGLVEWTTDAAGLQGTGVLTTDGDGTYDSRLQLEKTGDAWPLVRLWLIVDLGDKVFHPAALDMVQAGGSTFMGPGLFSHTNTTKHQPVGQARDWTGGLAFDAFDFETRITVLPDVLEHMWAH